MTTWYVDSGAGGAASGLTPADALTTIRSLFVASVTPGDVIWISKRHKEDLVSNTPYGSAVVGGANGPRRPVMWIGWPSSGDPFFEVRDTPAFSAGWDAHVNSTPNTFGETRYPIFVTSNNLAATDMGIRSLTRLYNMIFSNSGGPRYLFDNLSATDGIYFDNLWITTAVNTGFGNIPGSDLLPRTGKLVLGFSPAANTVMLDETDDQEGKHIDHLVIHSACNFDQPGVGVFTIAGNLNVQRVEIHCTSPSVAVGSAARLCLFLDTNAYPALPRIGRVYGSVELPLDRGAGAVVAGTPTKNVTIEDYYGRGPIIAADRHTPRFTRSSSTGVYNYANNPVTVCDINSQAITTRGEADNLPVLLNEVVLNGNNNEYVGIQFEFYTTAFSLAMLQNPVFMASRWGNVNLPRIFAGPNNLTASSSNGWAGTSLQAGSAWTMTATFQLQETGLHKFGLYAGWNSDATSLSTATRGHTGYFAVVNTPSVVVGV